MVHPYTKKDLERGEAIVQELHGLKGYEAWAERIAKEIAAERERCATEAGHAKYDNELGPSESAWNAACEHIADGLRGQR